MLSRRKVGRNHNDKSEVTMVQEKARVKIRTDSEKYLHPLNALQSHTHTHTQATIIIKMITTYILSNKRDPPLTPEAFDLD